MSIPARVEKRAAPGVREAFGIGPFVPGDPWFFGADHDANGAPNGAPDAGDAGQGRASDEADFPPSDVSSLRGGEALQPEGRTETGGDGLGRDPV